MTKKYRSLNLKTMKHLIIFLFISFSLVGQKKPIDKLTYAQSQDFNYFKTVRNNTAVNEYISKDGNTFKIGDTLILGQPTSQEQRTTVNSTFGYANTSTTKEFEFVQRGLPVGFGSILSAMNGQGPEMAEVDLVGEIVKIAEMKATHKGSKKKPLKLIMVIGELNGRAFGINKFLSVLDTELAYSYGEILLKNRKMSRQEAIAKLKESKELLELDLLTEDEYNKIKNELTLLIKG